MKNRIMIIVLTVLFLASCENTYIAYHKVKKENTVAAYEKFIKEHPKSKYADSANFEIVFLNTGKYPEVKNTNSEFQTTSNANKMENALWLNVKSQDTYEAYSEFIELYPLGFYKDSANIIMSYIDKNLKFIYTDSLGNETITLDLVISESGNVTGTLSGSSDDNVSLTWAGELNGIREVNWLKLNYIQTESSDDNTDLETENWYFIDKDGIYFNDNFYKISSENEEKITTDSESQG